MSPLSQSGADQAFERFRGFVGERALLGADEPRLSESDTRSKLIDPVFIKVLGWSEAEIRREKPSTNGYVDYVFGIDAALLLVEAKRTKPRFKLEVASKTRKLQLDGPHLLRNKKVKSALEQAQRYASDLGAQVAILTNGSQFILFRPYLPGKSWTNGIALVFHDPDDIVQNFALFHRLLSRDQVVSGALLDAFEEYAGITESLFTPIQYVHDPDGVLVRNPFWPKISKIMTPLLTDQVEDRESQAEIIRNCYVTTKLSDQTDKDLDRLLRDIPSGSLSDAGVTDTDSTRRGGFTHQFERDIEDFRPGTYVLTGGVGSGKTTFLRRFAMVVDPKFLEKYCIWIHIDFLTVGTVESSKLDSTITDFVYRHLRRHIEKDYPEKCPQDGEEMRTIFAAEIERVRKTKLYGIPPESADFAREIGVTVDNLYKSDEAYVRALLKNLARKGLRLVIVLDNTDQQGEEFQEKVFLFSQRLSQEHKALCIVALREERFFAAYRRGIFDAFGDRRFHIGSPDLRHVLQKRLEYGRKKFRRAASAGDITADQTERKEVNILLGTLIRSTTERNANIVRMLACVSNGDMRHALDMFREFVSSGNTHVRKVLEIVASAGGYTVPFHEFAKSAILGSRRYYRSGSSHIVNIFKKSAARRASHITGLRVLARLNRAEGAASAHGEGFVKTATLLREYRSSFGEAADFGEVTAELVGRGLVESEPPKVERIEDTSALRISAAGSYYWRYLARAFAYVDLVWIDTPIANEKLAKRQASLAESADLTVRFERVRAFLDYMAAQEEAELHEAARRAGPYRESLIPKIRKQIESEIRVIVRKTGASDPYGES